MVVPVWLLGLGPATKYFILHVFDTKKPYQQLADQPSLVLCASHVVRQRYDVACARLIFVYFVI